MAKQGLSKRENLKTKLVSCFEKRKNRMGEEEEEEEEEKRKKEESSQRYGCLTLV